VPDIELTCLAEYVHRKSGYKASFWRRSEFAEAVEMVVDTVDPKIRVLSRYNKRMRSVVDTTWQFLDSLTEHLPSELHISRQSFAVDPRVRVLFENADSMLRILNQSAHLPEFFASHPQVDSALAFLSMEKNEKQFFGMELDGDMLKREVLQTAVSFNDHHFLAPSLEAQKAKEGIKCYGFVALLKKVNQLIMQSHFDIKRLEDTKRDITAEIRKLRAVLNNAEGEDSLSSASIEKLNSERMVVESDLVQARIQTESPDRHMQYIIDVLREPQQYLRIERESLSVNNLGIKTEQAHVIEFATMEIENLLKRVAMIVSLHREDFSG